MKTLVYDNECPLCVAYTGAFVKAGLLKKEGRKNFNEISNETFQKLDAEKCNNEIPLIDNETGESWYGIDALLQVIGTKFPLVKTIGNYKAINCFLKKTYKLISYNRKVIVAVKPNGYDCSPTFSIRYRILLILLGIIFNSWIFSLAIPLINKTIFLYSSYIQLQVTHFSLIATNICIGVLLGKQKGLEYLGQVNMLAFIGMCLILPLICLQNILTPALLCCGLGIMGAIVTKEYLRRMKYANILKKNKIIVVLNAASAIGTFIYLY